MSRRGRRKAKVYLIVAAVIGAIMAIYSFYQYVGGIGILIIILLVIGALLIKPIIQAAKKEDKETTKMVPLTAEDKGKEGEKLVAFELNELAKIYNARVVNDVIILSGGTSSQIDHIFLHESGIYVIETKNYSGMLFGSENEKNWTHVYNYGKEKYEIYNPILQNEIHIKRISDLLNIKAHFHLLVVFVQGNIQNIKSDKVFKINSMRQYIKSHINERHLTNVELDMFYDKIVDYKNKPKVTIEEHIKHIKDPNKELKIINYDNERICPKCCSPLIIKTDKNDKQFLGCINYPDCKYQRNL